MDPSSTGEPLVCPDAAPPGHVGESDPACATVAQVGMFTPVVEWKKPAWAVNPGSAAIGMAPVVASLTDDNADGEIDELDVPDIVVVTFEPPVLRVVSGADGAEILSVTPPGLLGQSGVAVGDIDGDGAPEILANCDGSVIALAADGAMKWTSQKYTAEDVGSYGYSPPSISDMDGDGAPEIVFGRVILNNDGTQRGKGAHGKGGSLGFEGMAFAVDVDGDGTQEVVTGNSLYTPEGAAIWFNNQADGYPAVADFDADGTPEIVVVSDGHVRLQRSTDGGVLWDVPTSWRGGAPTIADFDGDGEPEVGVALANNYTVFNGDGTALWTAVTTDGSSAVTGSTVYDFEGDGIADVVYADEQHLWVFSGIDGTVKLSFAEHSSGTWFEYPLIADVDGDGQVEIVYVSQGLYNGITVLGDSDDSWRPGRRVWNQYNYHITNVNDDASIPANAALNWDTYNNFRSGDLSPNDGQAAPDLVLGEAEVCTLECTGDGLVLTFLLGNIGASALTAGATIEVLTTVNGVESAVDVIDWQDPLPEGTWADGFLYVLDPAGLEAIRLRVTANEEECDTANNELEIAGPFCRVGFTDRG